MRCGNVNEIFIFTQSAFRGGGKAGCACARRAAEVTTPRTGRAKHLHMGEQQPEQRWPHRSFHPTPGARPAPIHASPPRAHRAATRARRCSEKEACQKKAACQKAACLRRRPTRAGGSQDSSGARVSRARRQGTPWSVACPKEQGIATWRWSAATRPMLALNPPPLPHPESSTHHTQGHRHTFLPEVKQDSWF